MPDAATVLGLSAVSFAAVLLLAAGCDLRSRQIPDALSAVLAALALPYIMLTGGAWGLVLASSAGLAVFALGCLAFRFGLLGGGDVKLLTAASLWVSPGLLLPFLQATAIAGGLLALCYLLAAKLRGQPTGEIKLPYAVAIAAGGLFVTPELAGF